SEGVDQDRYPTGIRASATLLPIVIDAEGHWLRCHFHRCPDCAGSQRTRYEKYCKCAHHHGLRSPRASAAPRLTLASVEVSADRSASSAAPSGMLPSASTADSRT